MPLYEYQCDACAHRFEVIQRFADPPIDVCPKCGGAVKKLLSSPAIQFKGTGWYITDYARSGKTEGGSPPASSESKTDTKPETKPETKAEAKSEPAKTDSKGTP
jgi:putative FmdB family regulatory protein